MMNESALNNLLHKGVAEVIDNAHLEKRLHAGDTLRVKLGVDPSRPDLHIGHALTLRKLRAFQDAGHTAVLIIGDYTAQLGDPTDRGEARKMLSEEEVAANAKGYLDQVYKILDRTATEVHYQSEWFADFTLRDVFEMLAASTLNHMLSHETFALRLKEGQPLHAHEILYPFLQGYDSVAIKADVELGGKDQKFNLLMGRHLQRAHNLPEQDILMVNYIPGIDGNEKMSKSLGNTINLNDSPEEMFGKVMSMSDSLVPIYFELATQLTAEEVKNILTTMHPRDAKARLAKQIVTELHNTHAAGSAEEHFDRLFRRKEIPEDMQTLVLPKGEYDLLNILVERSTLVSTKSEARRLIQQKGVKVNQVVATDLAATIMVNPGEETIVQVGSRRFVKVVGKS